MRSLFIALASFVAGCVPILEDKQVPLAKPAPPNFLVIVADDLGFSDLGMFGGEIRTPNLDVLAARGLRLSDFHTAPLCSPTRAMLMTGLDNHRVGLGAMAERMGPQGSPNERLVAGKPGYEGFLSKSVPTIAERLRPQGYFTAISGKWHLGLSEEQSPAARGFDRSFVLTRGEGNHFGADQTQEWVEAESNGTYREDGRVATFPVGRYSADVFTDYMIDYLDAAKTSGKPFLAFMTYTQPHWPLQAPPARIAGYRGVYDEGPDALRRQRSARLQALGFKDAPPEVVIVDSAEWRGADPSRRAQLVRRMETHAAMIETMDANIGRLVEYLKTDRRLDNTYIIFLSDNGTDGSGLEGPTRFRGQSNPPELKIDNATENIGAATSYVAVGADWAQATMAPATRHKGLVYEGGIRSPALIAGPAVPEGDISSAFTHVTDVPTTILDLARHQRPRSPTLQGKSMTPLFGNPSTEIRSPSEPVGWEQTYGRAIRAGKWKAVFMPQSLNWRFPFDDPTLKWRLYDLDTDVGETTDLSESNPNILKGLVAQWWAYARENGVFVPDALKDR